MVSEAGASIGRPDIVGVPISGNEIIRAHLAPLAAEFATVVTTDKVLAADAIPEAR